ncbi:helix-turn-helix transcriptional regulator [Aneurinibacillus thermoaerophilus]|uniref:helix-turn-helix domain-containing protein n=1 Tax=Aneurinibacillus thermoaerophilus TaxID=143495 RepID=UPI002E2047CC|nr:helix-turn-helix transcriptional regulator [Aneurinibacillus thermoaerophilus]MED0764517.1 helix-turn-helix transcriptional regulator [Aneurinibacillus thermoaerophilus]
MKKVRMVRNSKDMTQNELADKAGIAQAYLSEIETGKTIPSIPVLRRIAKALGITVAELLDDEEQTA